MATGKPNRDAEPIAAAIEAMNKAADSLANLAGASAASHTSAGTPSSDADVDADRQRFYRDLEERGELVDVDESADLSSLPPRVTHVRYRDGRVVRVSIS
jgi:hypothetical protein